MEHKSLIGGGKVRGEKEDRERRIAQKETRHPIQQTEFSKKEQNDESKGNEMITQAEMVADTAKKHVAELKEMYAKGMDKKQSKKQNNKQSLRTKK